MTVDIANKPQRPIEVGTRVGMGRRELVFGDTIVELAPSNHLLGDSDALRAQLDKDGYLLIRNFHSEDSVLQAREQVASWLMANGHLKPGTDPLDAIINHGSGGHFFNYDELKGFDKLYGVLESPDLLDFYSDLFRGPCLTFDYKWLRATGTGGTSGAHYDVVYMGRGTKNLLTCWTPIGDVPIENGGLSICLGSREFDSLKRTYGEMDVDRDHVRGWFSDDPHEINEQFGGQWASTNYYTGDILMFGMYLMHGSLVNTQDRFRLTSDTRYQLATEPVDERWIGDNPKGHYAWHKGEMVSMEEARKRWGI